MQGIHVLRSPLKNFANNSIERIVSIFDDSEKKRRCSQFLQLGNRKKKGCAGDVSNKVRVRTRLRVFLDRPQATQLKENGFQYVIDMDGVKLFRKRK